MYGSPIKCEFWCMSPTCAQQPAFCCLQETDADDHDRICLTWEIFQWVVTAPRATAQVSSAFISSAERLRTQAQQLLPPGDRLVQGFADSRMHAASTPHDDCARVLLYFSWGGGGGFRKLIYYGSQPTALHVLFSICTVVLAAWANLLLF